PTFVGGLVRPMAAALIGLAGVIVGGLLTGLVSIARERAQEGANTTASVRVLALDLIELDSLLRWSLSDGVVHLTSADVRRTTGTWLSARELLARKLTADDWAVVARVFQTSLVWSERTGDSLDAEDRDAIGKWLVRLERAQDV